MRTVAVAAAFAAAYFAAAEAGHWLSGDAAHFATVWPAGGLYLAALLRSPPRRWPLLLFAALVASGASELLLHEKPPWVSAAFWLARSVETIAGAALLRRFAGDPFRLDNVRSVIILTVAAALGATMLGASIGALAAAHLLGQPLISGWLMWWSADALGVLLVAPLVLAALEAWRSPPPMRPLRAAEGAVMLMAVAGCAVWIFSVPTATVFPYVAMPLLLWAALRFGVGGTAAACTLFAVIAVRLTPLDHGPFAGASAADQAMQLQFLLGIYALTKLVIAALFFHQRRAEAALREANANLELRVAERTRALSESEQRYRTLVDLAPDAIFVNRDNRIVFANAACARLLGAPGVDFLLGRSPIDFTHPDHQGEVKNRISRLLGGGEVATIEQKFVRFDGTTIDVEVAATSYETPEGRAMQVLARNITERKRAEQALKEGDRRKDEFLAMLAHELRNPLAPIRNAVEVLRLSAPGDDTLARSIDIIARQVKHLAKLVDDLLDISRITRGKINLSKETLDPGVIVTQAAEAARPTIEHRRQRLRIDLPTTRLRIEADPTRLAQIVGNLLDNAAKYTPEGGDILLAVQAAGDEVLIRVRDRGIGITADMLPHVFDLFTQADSSLDRSQGGLGIGLALVRNLVELHGGRVEAHSAGQGQGSEFVVRLPIVPATTKEAPPPRLA